MKINEIFDTKFSSVPYSNPFGPESPLEKASGSLVGQGTVSRVHSDETDPHMVIKTEHKPFYGKGKPGYYHYIDIIKDKANQNPFFPRVYEVEEAVDNHGHKKFVSRIEKLIDLETCNLLELEALYYSLFKEKVAKLDLDSDAEKKYAFLAKMAIIINRAAKGGSNSSIKNEKLREAIKIIEKNSKAYLIDISESNIMGRRGPYGLQLVISDPYI